MTSNRGMNVLVTGAAGRLGRSVVNALRERGDQAIGVDLRGADRAVDVLDAGQLFGAAAGCDALIHCAAIPSPERHAAEVVFRTNVVGTFNALLAAERSAIQRIAIASSLSALGGAWAPAPHPPRYVPVDESHPLEVEDPYGLSKVVNERTAEMFARRGGASIVALRFGWILSAAEARHEAANVAADPASAALWGYIDERDAALACLAAIDANRRGYLVLNVIGGDTLIDLPTVQAIERFAPEVEIRETIDGFESPFSVERARAEIDWTPQYSWRDAVHVPGNRERTP